MLDFVTPVLVTSTPGLPELKEPEGIVAGPVKPELFRLEPMRIGLVAPVLVVAAVVVMPVLVL
jgi:hypothetical protein